MNTAAKDLKKWRYDSSFVERETWSEQVGECCLVGMKSATAVNGQAAVVNPTELSNNADETVEVVLH